MNRKKIDNRIRTLIENGVSKKHRTMIVIVGNSNDQVSLFISFWYIFSESENECKL